MRFYIDNDRVGQLPVRLEEDGQGNIDLFINDAAVLTLCHKGFIALHNICDDISDESDEFEVDESGCIVCYDINAVDLEDVEE
jgi:hypothetical protein